VCERIKQRKNVLCESKHKEEEELEEEKTNDSIQQPNKPGDSGREHRATE
jgi:hypothetical protein